MKRAADGVSAWCWIGLIVAGCLVTGGCGTSREDLTQEIYDLRSRQTQMMDRLYADFEESAGSAEDGGREIPEILEKAAEFVEGFSEQVKRETFEQQVRRLGRGERALALSRAARAFFERSDVRKRARQIVEIDLQINERQRRLESVEGS